jgi:hypothetical protein
MRPSVLRKGKGEVFVYFFGGQARKPKALAGLRRSTCLNRCPAILSGNEDFMRSGGIMSEHKRGNFTYENALRQRWLSPRRGRGRLR